MKEISYPYLKLEIDGQGYSRIDIAKILDIDKVTVSRKLRGGTFTVEEAKKLCKLLNKSFDYLFNSI